MEQRDYYEPEYMDPPRRERLAGGLMLLFVWLVVVALLLLPLLGCARQRQVNVPAGSAIGKAAALVDAAKTHTNSTCRELLARADGFLVEADAGTLALLAERDRVEGDLAAAQRSFAAYKAKWWIKAADWLHGMLVIVFWVYLALQIFATAATAFGGGTLFSVGKFLLNFLPFSNPFSTVSKRLQASRTK